MRHYDVEFATDDVKVYLAAAGAGKTHAMMEEMTEFLKVYRPDEIGFVTFTRKGVRNGIERAIKANPHLSPDDLVYFQTLHRMAFREAGLRHKNIIQRSDIVKFNRMLGFNLNFSANFDNQSDDDKMIQRYDAIRSGSTQGVFVNSTYDEERYMRLINAYEAFKKANDLVDFYDCLVRFRDNDRPLNIKVLLIDEAQDLTHLHWEVVEIISRNAEKIRIAGDDYQSLFGYSGASPETLIHLAQKHDTVKLEKSRRLSRQVYLFARGITGMLQRKVEKDYAPAGSEEGFVEDIVERSVLARKVRRDLELNGYKPGRWFFLFRANHFITEAGELLESFVVPYHTSKGFMIPERDLAKIKRYYDYRKDGFGSPAARQKFAEAHKIKNFDDDFSESELIPTTRRFLYHDYVERYGIDELIAMSKREPFVLLTTTYKVKGGECDFAAVFLDSTRLVSENTMFDLDSELRVLYVACTRPKIGLYLVSGNGHHTMNDIVELVRETMEA